MIATAVLAVTLAAQPAQISLSASPSRVAIRPGASALVRLRTANRRPLNVEAHVAGYALDLRGRPRIAAAAPLLTIHPRRLTVTPSGAALVVSTRRLRGARAGDQSALVLLTASAPAAGRVLVRIRIGLVVTVRVPGLVVHRLALRAVHVRRGRIELTLANRGNVIEPIDPSHLRLTLLRHGRVVARLRPERRRLLPRSTGLVELRYAGRAGGRVTARLELSVPPRVRSFPLRL
jgi:hypothetical protein